MDFFFLGAGRPASGKLPSALREVATNTRALDWQLNSLQGASFGAVHFLGGYHVEDIIQKYPNLSYTVIPDWEKHSGLHTLLKAPFTANKQAFISYADTIFRDVVISQIDQTETDVVLAYDSQWEQRYAGRKEIDKQKAELIAIENNKYHVPKKKDDSSHLVEFTGLVKFSPTVTNYLMAMRDVGDKRSLLDLLEDLDKQGFTIEGVDVEGKWAEFNSPSDIAQFILGTKAETLARLAPMVTTCHIGKQISFTTAQWEQGSDDVINSIMSSFPDTKLIVRSSAEGEDNWESSNAGGFESILNVDGSSKSAIHDAVTAVLQSYDQTGSPSNQVLVQEFIQDVILSGVVFTRDLETGSPYYRINYDDKTSSTESVTSGGAVELRTVICQKHYRRDMALIDKRLNGVLDAIQEIETLLTFDKLDIEFAIDQEGVVHIFQVRPITVDHGNYEVTDKQLNGYFDSSIAKFNQLQVPGPFVFGQKTFFGNMPDWNPAEIIGTRPKPLAFSLYAKLITNDIWAKQRAEFGYRDVRPQPLIYLFCGQPYVDIRASLNTFIPKDIDDETAKTLIHSYLDILEKCPAYHDKLEFDVAFTAWVPGFKQEAIKRFAPYDISLEQIDVFEQSLKTLTEKAFTRLASDIEPINTLRSRRKLITGSAKTPLEIAFCLLDDCHEFGTLAFSHAARAGFVAASFLKSFVQLDVISEMERNDFLRSIVTVAGEFEADRLLVLQDQMTKEACVEKYGHLRPGTYNAETAAYWEDAERYIFSQVPEHSESNSPRFSSEIEQKIQTMLNENEISIKARELTDYICDATKAREFIKFEFTKNLSLAIDNFIKFGAEIGISREDITFLTVDDFGQLLSGALSENKLDEIIKTRKQQYKITQMVELPQMIMSEEDFYSFERLTLQPNFVTSKIIDSKTLVWSGSEFDQLDGSIVLIPQADPGYDWLFGHNIAGLITKYGGANSHMAIRAAEMGLPAAIGVGDKLFEILCKSQHIQIDCENLQIRPL